MMIEYRPEKIQLVNGCPTAFAAEPPNPRAGKNLARLTIDAHNESSDEGRLSLRFDALISHDITYVSIIQTARACGLTEFPLPYIMTNCHNSLCAVGGTINEDDHRFGLSAARKYGGVFVPPNLAVIHQYARETLAQPGGMILGSDSHTRFGPFGCMGIGEGGGELVKQLVRGTYDLASPAVALVWLEGALNPGVGAMDAAIALCAAVYEKGLAKNKILEFAGPGVAGLSMDDRVALDVMTTETACLSSIWITDERTRDKLRQYGRADAYKPLAPEEGAIYDAMIRVDLSSIKPMIALPFHPSNAVSIREFLLDAGDHLREIESRASELFGGNDAPSLTRRLTNGGFYVDQGIIAGCAGGIAGNIEAAAAILNDADTGCGGFGLSVYPASLPLQLQLMKSGALENLARAGAVIKPCFCGPCFGAGDTPAHGAFSIRHTTRNFPNREGSKPGDGQLSYVALMDARSVAATARAKGMLTPADELPDALLEAANKSEMWDGTPYEKRVYNGIRRPLPDTPLEYGPNIADWPYIPPLGEHMLLEFAAVINDEVTTTDELIPSGETSSYRSNPLRLAQFTLSRRVPDYVERAKAALALENERANGGAPDTLVESLRAATGVEDVRALLRDTQFGSCVYAKRPGDGSAREQAASCQRVLGGLANVCIEYATKRYKSNCINWGVVPFTLADGKPLDIQSGDRLFVRGVRNGVESNQELFDGVLLRSGKAEKLTLRLAGLSPRERRILLAGCLMNFFKNPDRNM
ncbi:MAG: hydratase [Oscillospiraceae bacterium]|jgi:aconitate hydratase|nr:hydratase [Oscillospiraceae bacterium]